MKAIVHVNIRSITFVRLDLSYFLLGFLIIFAQFPLETYAIRHAYWPS